MLGATPERDRPLSSAVKGTPPFGGHHKRRAITFRPPRMGGRVQAWPARHEGLLRVTVWLACLTFSVAVWIAAVLAASLL